MTTSNVWTATADEVVEMSAGDNIDVTFFETVDGGSFTNTQSISVERVSGPSAITSTETIAFYAYKNAGSQSSNNAWQDVSSFTGIVFDTHGWFNSSTGVYTVGTAGKYQCNGSCSFSANSTGGRGCRFNKDGDVFVGAFGAANATYANTKNLTGIYSINAGGTIKLQAFQDSGGSLGYNTASDTTTYFSCSRIGL